MCRPLRILELLPLQTNLIPIVGRKDIARDRRTGAIVLINNDKVRAAKAQQERLASMEQRIEELQNLVAKLLESKNER
jgi:hypothetical protein